MQSQQEKAKVKAKAKGGGFGLRMTAAVIFAIMFIAFIVLTVVYYVTQHSNSFSEWFDHRAAREEVAVSDIVECDKEYEAGSTEYIIVSGGAWGIGDSIVEYPNYGRLNDIYYFSFEDADAKTLTFETNSGEKLTLSYANWESYSNYVERDGWIYGEVDILTIWFFVGIAGVAALLTILMFVGAFAGRKHKFGNVIGIILGAITTPALIGIFALVGGVKGNEFLNADKPGYKKKSVACGLRMTTAVIFAMMIFVFMGLGIYFYSSLHASSFMKWYGLWSRSEIIDNDGTVELISDKQYDNWTCIYVDNGENGSVIARIYSSGKLDLYKAISEDEEAKTLTFELESGEKLTLNYANWETYSKYVAYDGWNGDSDESLCLLFVFLSLIIALLTILTLVGAIAGWKHKFGNVISIIFGAITTPALVGIFALVGGIKGNKALKAGKTEPQTETEPIQVAQTQAAQTDTSQAQADTTQSQAKSQQAAQRANAAEELEKALAKCPVDYDNKPTVSQVLDPENTDNLVLTHESGETMEFRQLYVCAYQSQLYLIVETVGVSEEEGGGAALMRVNYDEDSFEVETDEDVCEMLWNEYKAAANAQYEKQQIKRSEFKLDLYDTNVDEKTWKAFKKTATQDELTVIAIGAKYRITHSRVMNIICTLGIILSIALFWPTGGWSLIGYIVFAFLATKAIRYQDTYSQSYRKLSKENKSLVDSFYNSSVGLKILDGIIMLATFWLTIPYQAVLMFIGTFAPNFFIAKNGVLISLPNGQDIGNLGAVGAYYASFNFIDEALGAMENSSSSTQATQSSPTDEYYKQDEYTYTDEHGYTQTVYTDRDGKEARDAGGNYAGEISGSGSEKKFTPAGSGTKDSDEE